jgi:hypothetical protein
VTPGDDEARLRAALAEAHREDARRMPAFGATWAAAQRGPGRRTAWRWAVLSTALVAAGVAAWLVMRPEPGPAAWPNVSTRWVGPTDFLLETPDLVTLRSVPTLDSRGLP